MSQYSTAASSEPSASGREFPLSSTADAILLPLIGLFMALGPLKLVLGSGKAWPFFLGFSFLVWPIAAWMMAKMLEPFGCVLTLGGAEVELKRRGRRIFRAPWTDVAAARFPNGEWKQRCLHLRRADGSTIGRIPLLLLSAARCEGALAAISSRLPDGVEIMDDPAESRRPAVFNALLGAFLVSLSVTALVLTYCGFKDPDTGPLYAWFSRYGAAVLLPAMVLLGIGVVNLVAGFAGPRQIGQSETPRPSVALQGVRGSATVQLFIDGSPERREFGYSDVDRARDGRKSENWGWIGVAVFAAFWEVVLFFGALSPGTPDHPNQISPGGEAVLIVAIQVLGICAVAGQWTSVRDMRRIARCLNDLLVVEGHSIWVRRDGRLLSATLKRKPLVYPRTSSRPLSRSRMCLEIEGIDCWYDPVSMEEIDPDR